MENYILISETEFRTLLSETIKTELASYIPAEQPKDNSLLTRQETADILGISLPTLITYGKKGKIKSYRVGRGVRYKRDEVMESLVALY